MTRFFMNLFDVFSKFMYTLKNYNLLLLFLRFSFRLRERKMLWMKIKIFCRENNCEFLSREPQKQKRREQFIN